MPRKRLTLTGKEVATMLRCPALGVVTRVRLSPKLLQRLINASGPDLLDSKQAAEYIGYSVRGLYRLIAAGSIVPIQSATPRLNSNARKRGGKKLRFTRSSLDKFRECKQPEPIKQIKARKRRPQRVAGRGLSKGWGNV